MPVAETPTRWCVAGGRTWHRNSRDGTPWRWAARSLSEHNSQGPVRTAPRCRLLPEPPSVLTRGPGQSPDPRDHGREQRAQACPHHGQGELGALRSAVAGSEVQRSRVHRPLTRAEPAGPCGLALPRASCPVGAWGSLGETSAVKSCGRGTPGQGPFGGLCLVPGSRELQAPGCDNWLLLWILRPSGWHQVGTTAQACLAGGGPYPALATWKKAQGLLPGQRVRVGGAREEGGRGEVASPEERR